MTLDYAPRHPLPRPSASSGSVSEPRHAESLPNETPAEVRARLRGLIRRLESRPVRPRPGEGLHVEGRNSEWRPRPWSVEETFAVGSASGRGREVTRRETPAGACWVIEERFALDHLAGMQPLAEIAHVAPATHTLLAPHEGTEDATVEDLVFLDIESSGLGGAGAMAFLVAAGRFEGGAQGRAFVLRQYLATSPPEEAGILRAVVDDHEVAAGDAVLVTYNGRTFDAPMLDGRATMHRQRAGFDALRHLDLLMPVRTGLRGALESCRLSMVETEVLQMTRPTSEVAGADVPGFYFRFLRSNDARLLAPIVEHNALDVVSLAALLARFGALLCGTREASPLDALALGRLHAARALGDEALRPLAVQWLERALDLLPPSGVRDDTLLRLAAVHRKAGRRDLAVDLWREVAARPDGGIAPLVEIAKALEHDRRDYRGALEVVHEAMRRSEGIARLDRMASARWRETLDQRRARLERRALRAGQSGRVSAAAAPATPRARG